MIAPFIIAELGINHSGRLDTALQLIAAAKRAGADVVKFQAFTPWRLCPENYERQAMLKGLALTESELRMCASEARRLGLEFLCTPMDEDWLRFCVEELHVARIKVGSAQAADERFMHAVGARGLPVIISNGMANNAAFCRAIETLVDWDCHVTPMYCVSKYPTPDADVRLSEIARLRDLFPGMPVGFSSHARSFWPCVAAAYAGVDVIEAHLALPGCDGPDSASSLDEGGFAAMVREIRARG